MHPNTYADMCASASDNSRERERIAFDQGIALLEAAQGSPAEAKVRREATRYMQILWSFLIRDLSDPANDLSDELKQNLVAIGVWVIKEADAILAGRSENWAGLIDINRSIREGLST